jgi:hypothetical protein
MVVIEPGVDDRNDLAGATSRLPGFVCPYALEAPEIGVGLRPAPCARQKGIVWIEIESIEMIGLDEFDVWILLQFVAGGLQISRIGEFDSIDRGQPPGTLDEFGRLPRVGPEQGRG